MSDPSTDIQSQQQEQEQKQEQKKQKKPVPIHRRLGLKLFIQMSGAPGSGKTTTAHLLAPRIDAFAIPHDNIKSVLLDFTPSSSSTSPSSSSSVFAQAGKMAYELDWTLAESAMRQGLSVIVDTPCLYPQILDRGQQIARAYGYGYYYLEIRARDLELLDARLRARENPLSVQRTAIDDVPRAAGDKQVQNENEEKDREKEKGKEAARERFRAMVANPCRPTSSSSSNIIVVDAASDLDERVDFILRQLSTLTDGGE